MKKKKNKNKKNNNNHNNFYNSQDQSSRYLRRNNYLSSSGFSCSSVAYSENNWKQKDTILDLAVERKKKQTLEHEDGGDTNWCTRNDPKKFGKRLEELEIRERIKTI